MNGASSLRRRATDEAPSSHSTPYDLAIFFCNPSQEHLNDSLMPLTYWQAVPEVEWMNPYPVLARMLLIRRKIDKLWFAVFGFAQAVR
jgi:hypothetical protein